MKNNMAMLSRETETVLCRVIYEGSKKLLSCVLLLMKKFSI